MEGRLHTGDEVFLNGYELEPGTVDYGCILYIFQAGTHGNGLCLGLIMDLHQRFVKIKPSYNYIEKAYFCMCLLLSF